MNTKSKDVLKNIAWLLLEEGFTISMEEEFADEAAADNASLNADDDEFHFICIDKGAGLISIEGVKSVVKKWLPNDWFVVEWDGDICITPIDFTKWQ